MIVLQTKHRGFYERVLENQRHFGDVIVLDPGCAFDSDMAEEVGVSLDELLISQPMPGKDAHDLSIVFRNEKPDAIVMVLDCIDQYPEVDEHHVCL